MLEFYPIVLSLYLRGHQMQNRSILFLTDNEALVHVINKQSCKNKILMFFVRKLVLVCLENILFKAKHVRGVYNTLADSLSRLQVDTFKRLAPVHMEREPTDIPVHLQPQNWHLQFPHYCSPACNLPRVQLINGHGSSFHNFYM